MNRIIFICGSIICLNLQANDLAEKLTNCLDNNRNQINHVNETEALKAVSSCLTGFVKSLEEKADDKNKTHNSATNIPNSMGSYSLPYQTYSSIRNTTLSSFNNPFVYNYGRQNLGWSVDGINNADNLHSSYNFFSPPIHLPEIVKLGNEGDGTISVYYGTGALGSGSNTGVLNTAFGYNTLNNNTSGRENVAIGYTSMQDNTTGSWNIAIGTDALGTNVSGDYNLAIGRYALQDNTADDNFAIGYKALEQNTTGTLNQASGIRSLQYNTTGDYNLAYGIWALKENTTADYNTALGNFSLQANTTGHTNVGVGLSSLFSNTTGSENVATGVDSLKFNTTGNNNIAIGLSSLETNTTGSSNTAIGFKSGYSNLTGSSNVFIGNEAGYNETGSHKLYIANSSSQNLIQGDFSTGYLSFGRAGLTDGGIGIHGDLGAQFMDDDASHYVAFVAPTSVSSNVTWTLPGADGTSGQVLSTDGAGTLTWSTVSSGTGTTNSSLSLDKGTLTLTDSSGGKVSVDISGIDADTNDYVISTSLSDNVLKLTMNSGTELSQDLSSLTTNLSADTNTYLESAALDGSNLVITMSDSTTKTIDLAGISENNTNDIATNTASISTNTASISNNITTIAALGSDLNDFKSSTNNHMTYMRSEYSSGIASAIAMGQISIAEDGFSVGVGHGRFNGQGEQVFGIGFGGKFDNGTRFKIQASKNSMASGVGFTLSY
tara:strand:- start:119 stop:2272 length:2154 start_codon:yes stop_codon:yes gene_type:complete